MQMTDRLSNLGLSKGDVLCVPISLDPGHAYHRMYDCVSLILISSGNVRHLHIAIIYALVRSIRP
jgi:hypothetical protein